MGVLDQILPPVLFNLIVEVPLMLRRSVSLVLIAVGLVLVYHQVEDVIVPVAERYTGLSERKDNLWGILMTAIIDRTWSDICKHDQCSSITPDILVHSTIIAFLHVVLYIALLIAGLLLCTLAYLAISVVLMSGVVFLVGTANLRKSEQLHDFKSLRNGDTNEIAKGEKGDAAADK